MHIILEKGKKEQGKRQKRKRMASDQGMFHHLRLKHLSFLNLLKILSIFPSLLFII